jgi:hypothetical protein
MNIQQLKIHLCELIDAAYTEAKKEGRNEIIHPFTILIREDEEVEYLPLHRKQWITIHPLVEPSLTLPKKDLQAPVNIDSPKA